MSTPPITLTVMPDFGMSPFLWLNREGDGHGVGGNCCDATSACGQHPLSPELHLAFAAWAMEFGAAGLESARPGFSWRSFHKRGLALARRLKTEVGDGFRVLYLKPNEDPYRHRHECREVRADGGLALLPRDRTPPSAS